MFKVLKYFFVVKIIWISTKKISINLSAKQGSLVGIVGSVGSGKSSILSGILGEMYKFKGTISLNGSIAYAPQLAFIQNASLKDNVLFGNEFDEQLYQQVIKLCCLEQDINILPNGDLTEIGEKVIFFLNSKQMHNINIIIK